MADIAHGTLVAATVTTVTLDSDVAWVEVVNRDGADEITFLVDPGATDPTVGQNDAFVIPAAISALRVRAFVTTSGGTVVKMISAGIPKYTVQSGE